MGREEASAAADLVTGAFAIRQLMEELSRSHAPLSLSDSEGRDITPAGWIEHVDAASGWLCLSEQTEGDAIRPGSRLRVRGRVDGVAVVFTIDIVDITAPPAAGGALCRFPLPQHAERIQRRGAYRIRAPLGKLGELVRRVDGSERRYPVLDLSGDGIGVLATGAHGCETGELWRHCRLEIEKDNPIPCDLTVRTLGGLLDIDGVRIGCAFERPTPEARRTIEKYVLDFQRAARGLARS